MLWLTPVKKKNYSHAMKTPWALYIQKTGILSQSLKRESTFNATRHIVFLRVQWLMIKTRELEMSPLLRNSCSGHKVSPAALHLCLEYQQWKGSKVIGQVSRKRLDDDDFLVDAETVKHTEQVLSTSRHLPLHGQTEIFFYTFGDSTSHCVVSEKIKRIKKINTNIHMVKNVLL